MKNQMVQMFYGSSDFIADESSPSMSNIGNQQVNAKKHLGRFGNNINNNGRMRSLVASAQPSGGICYSAECTPLKTFSDRSIQSDIDDAAPEVVCEILRSGDLRRENASTEYPVLAQSTKQDIFDIKFDAQKALITFIAIFGVENVLKFAQVDALFSLSSRLVVLPSSTQSVHSGFTVNNIAYMDLCGVFSHSFSKLFIVNLMEVAEDVLKCSELIVILKKSKVEDLKALRYFGFELIRKDGYFSHVNDDSILMGISFN
ncbi:hypothetical protein MP228_010354 [Amoeboaphelidium protococcarum]|nr:hypothetical protein MP228_010354 [Amoeboaphelidium protococcarum]